MSSLKDDERELAKERDAVLAQLDDTTNQTWVGKRKRWASLVRAQDAQIRRLRAAANHSEAVPEASSDKCIKVTRIELTAEQWAGLTCGERVVIPPFVPSRPGDWTKPSGFQILSTPSKAEPEAVATYLDQIDAEQAADECLIEALKATEATPSGAVQSARDYEAWRDFYASRVTAWMNVDQLRDACGGLWHIGVPSPELLLVHAMRALELEIETRAEQEELAAAQAAPLRSTAEDERKDFEAAISGPPYERSVERYPDDATKYAWPGSYRDIGVDLAWCMWRQARAVPSPSMAGEDAARFVWFMSDTPKGDFMTEYLLGVREGWNLDQWRACIDTYRSTKHPSEHGEVSHGRR